MASTQAKCTKNHSYLLEGYDIENTNINELMYVTLALFDAFAFWKSLVCPVGFLLGLLN